MVHKYGLIDITKEKKDKLDVYHIPDQVLHSSLCIHVCIMNWYQFSIESSCIKLLGGGGGGGGGEFKSLTVSIGTLVYINLCI